MRYVSRTQRRFEIANRVAIINNLPTIVTKSGVETYWVSDDNSRDCPRCGNIMRRYQPAFGTRASYEYDEWEYYCSPACADGHANVGTVSDFLERMGWTLYWNNPSGDMVWGYVPGSGPVKAVEGSAEWHADRTKALRLERQVDKAMMMDIKSAPKSLHAPIRSPRPTNV